ncbi:MAG: hypothetical protein PUC32_03525 [Oscillospiraceae bacterium]|nr:hypothetical protein [Oscillospiraceae bacterium]
MDTAIGQGDFQTDVGGKPILLTGLSELLQQVWIRLQAKRGAFCYLPSLGSRLATLSESQWATPTVLSCIEEALTDGPAVTILGTEVHAGTLDVTVSTRYGIGTVTIQLGKEEKDWKN